MNRHGWLWLVNRTLIVALVLLTLAGFGIIHLVSDDVSKARQSARENLTGMAAQFDYELNSLVGILGDYALARDGVSRDDVVDRLDVAFSRLDTNTQGHAATYYLRVAGAREALAVAREALEAAEPLVLALTPETRARATEAQAILRPAAAAAHNVMLQAVLHNAELAASHNDLRQRLNFWFLATLAAAIVVSSAVIAVLLYEYRQVETMSRGLEARVRERTAELSDLNDKLSREIGERAQLEARIRTQSTWLTAILDNSPAQIVLKDIGGAVLAASSNCRELFVGDGGEFVGRRIEDLLPPDMVDRFAAMDEQVLETGRTVQREIVRDANQRSEHHLCASFPLHDDADAIAGICTISSDISEIRHAEARLRQGQKLEAIGQLTGGVAHDFNNLLAVVVGNLDLIAEDLGIRDRRLDAVFNAARRGAELTHRLLAYARRQALSPRAVDIAGLVRGMHELLSRTLGENIVIVTDQPKDLWRAQVDPGQVESAVINLAVNARDAMPQGGRLTIACANVTLGAADISGTDEVLPGDYVMLSVSDNGTGMSEETLTRAFEPFYTTKEVGQGSGLGLSMVYGFVRQSNGQVQISSAAGVGTTVRIHLPRAREPGVVASLALVSDLPQGSGERILVIEDDEDVAGMVGAILERLGYRVLAAGAATAAMTLLREGAEVDLVLSDVVLPGRVSGPEFARTLRDSYPRLPVIFMSGYAPEAAGGALGDNDVLLTKPFDRRRLAVAIREALDRAA